MYFYLRSFFETLYLFSLVTYPFSVSVIISPFQYFASKLFGVLVIRLLLYVSAFTLFLQIEFSFVVLECLYLYCFILFRCHFSLPSFFSTFCFIYSNCIICFTCWVAFFLFVHTCSRTLSLSYIFRFFAC